VAMARQPTNERIVALLDEIRRDLDELRDRQEKLAVAVARIGKNR